MARLLILISAQATGMPQDRQDKPTQETTSDGNQSIDRRRRREHARLS